MNKYINEFDLNEVGAIVEKVYESSLGSNYNVRPVGGCGRVYVELGKIRKGSKVAKIIERRFKVFSRPGS